VVTVRDLIDTRDRPPTLATLVRPALVVPETKMIAELLQEFQAAASLSRSSSTSTAARRGW